MYGFRGNSWIVHELEWGREGVEGIGRERLGRPGIYLRKLN
jgi:hypothetical protein